MTSLQQLKDEVDLVKADLLVIKSNTAELLSAFNDAKGALKVLALIGAIARWITAVAGAFALLYLWFKRG